MRTDRCCLLRCCLVAILLLPTAAAFTQDADKPKIELTFKGRTFDEWKRLIASDLDVETRADAYRALNAFSYHNPDVYLRPAQEVIKTHLPKEKTTSVLEVGYSRLSKWTPAERLALWKAGLRSDIPAHRGAASKALHAYHTIPTELATEELAEVLMGIIKKETDRDIRIQAMGALRNIVTASEYEYDWTTSPPTPKKIRPKGEYGPIVKKAIPLTEKLLNDADESIRTDAVYSVMSFPPELAVKQFADQLVVLAKGGKIRPRIAQVSDDARIARVILGHLRRYGAKAKSAVPVLEQLRRDFPDVDDAIGSYIRSTIREINAAKS